MRSKRQRPGAKPFAFGTLRPCLGEESSDSGLASGHYFHQDLLVARRIFLANVAASPRGRRLPGRRLRRPRRGVPRDRGVRHPAALGTIPNVTFIQADLMAPLPAELVDYCDSLSCLHALEHFGLGRYGDPSTTTATCAAWTTCTGS